MPVHMQLRELAEQTAKWRSRRGLHIVRTPNAKKGRTHHDKTAVRDHMRDEPATSTGDASCSQWLRTSTTAAVAPARVSVDETDVRMRREGKLPLGV